MDNADAAIADGVTCEMTVNLAAQVATAIPRSALIFSDAGQLGVRVAGNDNKVKFMPVAMVDDGRESVWVSGIDKPTRVIVVGQDFVKDGGRGRGRSRRRKRTHEGERGATARMRRIVDIAVSHARLTIAILIFLLAAGALAYINIPKESQPDVQIPYIYVQLSERGISPEDSERLLLRPMETQLKTVSDVKTMHSAAFRGRRLRAYGIQRRLQLGRSAPGRARQGGRRQAEHSLRRRRAGVYEVSLSLFPVISVALSGDISERSLTKLATDLQNSIKEAPGRALGRPPRHPRPGGGDHRRADALEELRASISASSRWPRRRATAWWRRGDLEGTPGQLRHQGAGAHRDARGRAQHSGGRLHARLGDAGATSATILPTFKDATSITRVNASRRWSSTCRSAPAPTSSIRWRR